MTTRSVAHATFSLERHFAVPPSAVFAAWADKDTKTRWFTPPAEWAKSHHELDFRVGGREQISVTTSDGDVHVFNGIYNDIVPDERIVWAYEMLIDGRRISVSLATVELQPEGAGTRMVFTEQGAFLDGLDSVAAREDGTEALLDKLAAELAG